MSVCAYIGLAFGWKALEKSGDNLDKIAEKLFGGRYNAIYEDVAARLRAHTGGVPTNHDLEHAIRLSELTASLVLVRFYVDKLEEEQLRLGGRPPERRARIEYAAAARRYLHEQIGVRGAFKIQSNKALVDEIEANLDSALAARDSLSMRAGLEAACERVLQNITGGTENGEVKLTRPDDFAAFFRGEGTEDAPGWALIFLAFMREALKQNHKAEIAFVASRLGYLRASLPRLEAKSDELFELVSLMKGDMSDLRHSHSEMSGAISRILSIVQRQESYSTAAISFQSSIKIEIAINERGDLIIFHNKSFNEVPSEIEFNVDRSCLSLVMTGGFSCNIPLRNELCSYMMRSTQALMVLMEDENREPVEGGYLPLYVMKRQLGTPG
ncbi:hypothetical protein FJ872_30765 [Mesorhizobium sp. B2-5-9]|uniref:hypothetical protein n=1 Tax=Mesorhizobium sp. B2-5-9 TaxID=2589921 RepID=UPI00112A3A5E|nr:hypothetical protein [Mesorhizobium sp. B2-5-9]TPJ99494.1 hypothetical protein FJ872_30765 [Mesorhizobium sp. B2-5-9]